MRLVTYLHPDHPHQPRMGALIRLSAAPSAPASDAVIDLDAACTWAQKESSITPHNLPASLLEFINADEETHAYANEVLATIAKVDDLTALKGIAHPHASVRLLPPIHPPALRDAYAFEQHVKTANENRGRSVPEGWYRFPVFYYTSPHSVIGPDDPLPYPRYTKALDYELEIGAVIGKSGIDLGAEEAASHIFGFTIFNDWSARDIQREEMKVGLGPAKGKDFASSLGPCIITVDELADRATGRPGVFDLAMEARVNDKTLSRGNLKDIYWSFGEIIARASEQSPIHPGDVIGSGTVGTGCLLELTKAEGPWLQPGDTVELEIERIGILRNNIITNR